MPAPTKVSIRIAVDFSAEEEIPSRVVSSHHDFLSDLFKKKKKLKKYRKEMDFVWQHEYEYKTR